MGTVMPDQAPGNDDRPDNWSMGRLLSTAARAVERSWADALDQRGLTHAGFIVLHLLDQGVTSQSDLARLAHVEAQTMSRTVDRLEREGHVQRHPDTGDRRRHVVWLTERGRTTWQETQGLEQSVFPSVKSPEALRKSLLEIMAATRRPE